MKRFVRLVALFMVFTSVFSSVVSADDFDNTGSWINVLDYATLNDSGSNYISFNNSVTVRYDTEIQSLIHFVDIVVNTSGADITSASINGNSLSVISLDSQVFRIYGDVRYITSGVYDLILNSSGETYADILQFHVSGQWRLMYEEIGTLSVGSNSYTMTSSASSVEHLFSGDNFISFTAQVYCPAWKKYDFVDFYVTCFAEGLDSISARFNGLDVPIDVSYLGGSTGTSSSESNNKIMIRMDVRGLDRTIVNYPFVELSGVADTTNNNRIVLVKVTGSVVSDSINPFYLYFSVLGDRISGLFDAMAQRQDAYHSDLADWNEANEQFLTDKFAAVNSLLSGISSAIVSMTNTLKVSIDTAGIVVEDKLTDLQSSMVTWFTTVSDQLDQLIHSDTSGSEQFQDDIASQTTEMEDISETLDSVTKPPVEDLDPSVDDIVSPDDIENYTSILGILLGNNIFLSVCLMSFTLALVSYTLYGKR